MKFLDHFGLVYGVIETIRIPDGSYVFLENNPVGQFGWVEGRTGVPLAPQLGVIEINSRSLFLVKKGLMPNAAPQVEIRLAVVTIPNSKRDEHVE